MRRRTASICFLITYWLGPFGNWRMDARHNQVLETWGSFTSFTVLGHFLNQSRTRLQRRQGEAYGKRLPFTYLTGILQRYRHNPFVATPSFTVMVTSDTSLAEWAWHLWRPRKQLPVYQTASSKYDAVASRKQSWNPFAHFFRRDTPQFFGSGNHMIDDRHSKPRHFPHTQ